MHLSLLRVLVPTMLAAHTAFASAQGAAAFAGAWKGQVQWYATVGAKPDPQGHSVDLLTISLDPRGKVEVLAANGCKGLGLSSSISFAPTVRNVDVTFAGCTYAGYNGRFGGTVALYDQGRVLTLQLNAQRLGIGTAAFFEVKGSLSR